MKTIAECDREIRQNPNDAKLYNERGIVYMGETDNGRAIADFSKAIQLDPNYYNPYYNRGLVYFNTGDYDKALEDSTKAMEIDPTDTNVYYLRGSIFFTGKDDNERAITDFSQAIKIAPDNPGPYYKRGHAYLINNDYDRAIADYNQVMRIDPPNTEVYLDRGDAYFRKGESTKAIADFDYVIQKNPNYAKAYFQRAMAYGVESEQAIKDWETALRLKLDSERVKLATGFIELTKKNLFQKKMAKYDLEEKKSKIPVLFGTVLLLGALAVYGYFFFRHTFYESRVFLTVLSHLRILSDTLTVINKPLIVLFVFLLLVLPVVITGIISGVIALLTFIPEPHIRLPARKRAIFGTIAGIETAALAVYVMVLYYFFESTVFAQVLKSLESLSPFLVLAIPVGIPALAIGIESLVCKNGFTGCILIVALDIVMVVLLLIDEKAGIVGSIGYFLLSLVCFTISAVPGGFMAFSGITADIKPTL